MDELVVAVDLGGTQIRAAVLDAEGKVMARVVRLTKAEEGLSPVLGRIREAIHETLAQAPLGKIRAIGVGSPGPLDPFRGIVRSASNLPGWRDVPLRAILEEEFPLPVHLGNDANVAALAEQIFGGGKGLDNLIYLTISTGIGGGIIADGKLLLGTEGLAAEVGHMVLEPEGPRCTCGKLGCLQALASGVAIAREAAKVVKGGAKTLIGELVEGDASKISAKVVSEAAAKGDEVALKILAQAGFHIGLGIVNLVHLFNPQAVIIGGGVSKAGPNLFDPIRRTVRERALPSFQGELTIQPSALGDDVGLLGAAALALMAER